MRVEFARRCVGGLVMIQGWFDQWDRQSVTPHAALCNFNFWPFFGENFSGDR